ncbi:hypothetical protein [Mycobacterium avium]|nr:hypothetical protein [Mycobacterium avium]
MVVSPQRLTRWPSTSAPTRRHYLHHAPGRSQQVLGSMICINLRGNSKRVEGQETDPPAVWMRLVVLGVKFREAYGVDARVTDPDVEGTGSGDASPAPVS